MALIGTTIIERIINFLRSKGLNDFGIAGVLGNMFAESGLNPCNLQNTYEKKFGMTDQQYTNAVDNGTYTNFVNDKAGYGLCQWTYWSRKQNLLNFAKESKVSIGDPEMQLEFFYQELSISYPAVLNVLKTATSVRQASNAMLINYERPASQGKDATEEVRIKAQNDRATYSQNYYDKYIITQNTELTVHEFINLYQQIRKEWQDNDCSEYSSKARAWAIKNGLIVGNGTEINGEPNYMWGDIITREQLVTVLYRFTKML